MVEPSDELKKLVAVATDSGYPVKLRIEAIESISNNSTHEAVLALLGLAANEHLTRGERELAIKRAGKIIKSGH